MKTDILAFGAHPDDVELSCSGTIIKHIKLVKKIGIIDLTRGELGTRGDVKTRAAEATAAAKILGVQFRENMNFEDGFFFNSKKNQMAVVKMIRRYQPEIILANAIADRHPDHARAAQLVSDACFLSGLVKVKTKDNGKLQKQWRVKAVYHYIQDRYMKPDFLVDISDCMEQRMKAIKAFKSQFYDEYSAEPETPISSKQFLESLYYRPLELGRMIGVKYAEGFTAERLTGVKNLFDLV
ncbi:MAG: bacillithiol biosynthesis deacetylase BshB1 [Bacteroidia bacterium]